MPNRRDYLLVVAVVAVILAILILPIAAFSQTAVVVEAEPLPDYTESWAAMVAYWLPRILNGVVALIGALILFAIRHAVAMLPSFMQAWIDTKRQRDLHSAIKSKISELILEGRWPAADDLLEVGGDLAAALRPELVKEIQAYVKEYNPQAAAWAKVDKWTDRADNLLRTLAARQSVELSTQAR